MKRYIKVDDIISIKGIAHVVKEVKPGTTTVESVNRGRRLMYNNQNLFEYLPDYREMYEQQKHRADAAEANWEKLKVTLKDKDTDFKNNESLGYFNDFLKGEFHGTQVVIWLMDNLEGGKE